MLFLSAIRPTGRKVAENAKIEDCDVVSARGRAGLVPLFAAHSALIIAAARMTVIDQCLPVGIGAETGTDIVDFRQPHARGATGNVRQARSRCGDQAGRYGNARLLDRRYTQRGKAEGRHRRRPH